MAAYARGGAVLAAALMLGPAAAQAGETAVSFGGVLGNRYSPSAIRVAPGDSVAWSGNFQAHPLVSDDGLWPTKSSGATFSQPYPSTGRFAFHCELHGSTGMTGLVTVTQNHLPTASFTGPATAMAGETVAFDGSGSADPDGGQTITRYEWDLDGDGSFETDTGTDPHVTTTYAAARSMTVRLRVTDSNAEPGVGPEQDTTGHAVTVASTGPGTTPPPPPGVPPGSAGTQPSDAVAPKVALVRSASLALRVRSTEAARATAVLRAGTVVLARGRTSFAAPGTRTLRLVPTARGRARLHARHRLAGRLTIRVADAAGNVRSLVRAVVLHR